MGFDVWKDIGATLGRSVFKKADSEVGVRGGVRGVKGDWFSGCSGLAGVKSIGRNEISIRKRGQGVLFGIFVPCGWSADVAERAKRLVPAAGQVHDRQSTLPKV